MYLLNEKQLHHHVSAAPLISYPQHLYMLLLLICILPHLWSFCRTKEQISLMSNDTHKSMWTCVSNKLSITKFSTNWRVNPQNHIPTYSLFMFFFLSYYKNQLNKIYNNIYLSIRKYWKKIYLNEIKKKKSVRKKYLKK